jgi:glycosyltransferase involved in cell wall biosynthesis
MRILMLNYEFPPLGAGGATSSFNLARNIVRLGHEVDVVTMSFRGVPSHQELDGVQVYRAPSIRSRKEVCHTHEMVTYVASGTLLARRLIRQRRYDICNAHFVFPTGPIAYMLRRLGGPPYVLTARGSDVPGHNPNRFRFDHRLLQPVWAGLVRDADARVAVSNHLRTRMLAVAPGIDVEVIPNGCSPIEPSAASTDAVPHRDNGVMRILSVNRLHEFKGVQFLLDAVEGLEFGVEVHVVGDGPYRSTLERQAQRIAPPVRFWGWLDRSAPELAALYGSASVFVFPSEREGSPAVLQEAMSAGLPVVAADSAGTPEVVGTAGILVPPRDPDAIRRALRELHADPSRAVLLAECARERVRDEFDWAVLARRYVDLYTRVVDGRRAR